MRAQDTIVVGAGVVGLCIANALARKGQIVALVGEHRAGEASRAAAGMLAPSVEQSEGPAHDFAIAARDFYPEFLELLADDTGVRVPLNRLGILQVALTSRGVKGLRKTAPETSTWLERDELVEMEPTLGHALGAVFNPDDGAVDNVILMNALEAVIDDTPTVTRFESPAASVSRETAAVTLASGQKLDAATVVIAAGAWASSIDGVNGIEGVAPCRGQLVSYKGIGLRHVTYGPRGYLVPRASGTVVAGSTMEQVGFNAGTTPEGLAKVKSAAEEIAPALAISPIADEWAGLRPITPDMLPIIGKDPEAGHIIYAVGHGRNGILLAPLSGEAVAALAVGESPAHDLTQFRPARF
ncbi:MAG TPA: FAD-dependent oxidoreductase [Gemmatimonadaceae bacterium]|nr:FAD-dependent oxidoreductase [Gemmatimonadaceae bacterium]